MTANLDQLPADGTQRLVIRFQKSKVTSLSVVIGTTSLIGAGLMLVRGTLSAALFCVGIGGLAVYAMVSAHLWVDSERVGVSRLPWGASCRRDQLGRLQIVFGRKGNSLCEFVRKDGHTAFRVSANLYGTTQLSALARSLGVPYYDLFSASSIDIQPGP
jgi:hypothetical protein